MEKPKKTTKAVTPKKTTVKKAVTKKATKKEIESPYIPEMAALVSFKEVDAKTRTVLLLDSRNDLVTLFFAGLDAMAANYETKAVNQFVDFIMMTSLGFIETVRDKSKASLVAQKKNPTFGIGDLVKNRKGKYRMIINMLIDQNELIYVYIDPADARTPRMTCSEKTLISWSEKI